MRYPLEAFKTIPTTDRLSLNRTGISSTDDLLHWGARPDLREELACKSGVPLQDLTRWVGMADLVRIKGIGPQFAQLLVTSGIVGNVQQFVRVLGVEDLRRGPSRYPEHAKGKVQGWVLQKVVIPLRKLVRRLACGARHHTIIPATADSLGIMSEPASRIASDGGILSAAEVFIGQLKNSPDIHALSVRLPTRSELAEAVEEAVELRPRVVLTQPSVDDGFRKAVYLRARVSGWYGIKSSLLICGILLSVLLLVILSVYVWLTMRTNRLAGSGDSLVSLFGQLWSVSIHSLSYSMALLAVLAFLMLLVLFLVYALASFLQETLLVYALFDTPARRAFYRETQRLGLEEQKRGARWGIAVFGAIALGLGAYAVVEILGRPTEDMVSSLRRLVLPIAVGGSFIVAVTAWPVVRFWICELRGRRAVTEDSFRHYLMYLLSKLAWIPLLIVLVTQTLLPYVFDVHRLLYRVHILPSLESEIVELRSEVLALPIEDESDQLRRERMLRSFDETVTDELAVYGTVDSQDLEVFDILIPLARNIVFWVVLATVVSLFVFPYLVLWDLRRAIFYLALVLVAFMVEEHLQQRAPSWFSLPVGSLWATAVVLTVVFAIALFFDWLYDRFSERKTTCPGCEALIAADLLFCPNCGLANA